ncbi:hypothetical protein [Bifidobacterium cuniculi]|uniref:Uncharacterized protein n=1 Tax=Bifidobacterium cuniculi TaxID=1688 RepID=A0A087ATI2_9BIFI|nr:hypothetical protein [Bifidobacterium cuniculi]KFI62082.1 hypothetical protein BCUN_1398 [Bifidobacterium cuniculi]
MWPTTRNGTPCTTGENGRLHREETRDMKRTHNHPATAPRRFDPIGERLEERFSR